MTIVWAVIVWTVYVESGKGWGSGIGDSWTVKKKRPLEGMGPTHQIIGHMRRRHCRAKYK